MSYVFPVTKKFDSLSKDVISGLFSVHFRWNIQRRNFIAPKESSLDFRGSLLSYFWAIMLISAVLSILEEFGSLLLVPWLLTVKFQAGSVEPMNP